MMCHVPLAVAVSTLTLRYCSAVGHVLRRRCANLKTTSFLQLCHPIHQLPGNAPPCHVIITETAVKGRPAPHDAVLPGAGEREDEGDGQRVRESGRWVR